MLLSKHKTKKLMKNLFWLVVVICSLNLNTSCSNYLDVDSTEVASEDTQWNQVEDARSGLMGIYGLFRSALADNNAHWMYGEVRMGDFKSYDREDINAVVNNQLNASYPLMEDLSDWRRFYAVINAASVFIEKAPRILKQDTKYSDVNLKLDIAQARALRAFAYFYMVRIWGDVPLIPASFDNGTFNEFARSDANTVLNYAESEMLTAAKDLPYLYGVNGQLYYGQNSTFWSGALFSKISAYAVLSHIAAWKGNYINTEIYSRFVQDNYSKANITTQFSTVTTLTSTTGFFAQKSASQMVAFNFIDFNGESSQTGHIEDLTLAEPFITRLHPQIYVPKETILSVFNNPNDLRFGIDTIAKAYRTNYFANMNNSVPVFSKIKILRDGVPTRQFELFGSALVFTRMEEITLLRAEALGVINRKADAIVELNKVRSIRGLPIFIDTDGDVLDAIFQERRRELMGEGWRWYDRVRYERIKKKDSYFIQLENNKTIYWPVSDKVLQSNSKITQNSYWK